MSNAMNDKIKVLAIFKAPTPYTDPLFRMWADCPDVDLTVVYCVKTTDGESYYDAVLKKNISWGNKLLLGYKYVFLNDELEPIGKADYKISNPEIKNYIEENDIDVILLASGYWSPTTWMAIRAAKKKRIPIVTRMTVEAERKRSVLVSLLKWVVVGRYCSKVNAGVYECRQQMEYMMKYGMKSETLFSSPCAVDNDYFAGMSQKYDKSEIRRGFNIDKDSFVLVSTGMVIPRKRQIDVINSLHALKEEGVEPYYFIVGDGVDRSAIEQKIQEYGLSRVRVTGQLPQNEMSKYLAMADAYILSSENDASPKALNEAMNFSLPIIISTGVGTSDNLLKDGVNGYIYSPGDCDALLGIIKKILSRNDIDEMGKASLELVSACSYKRVIEGWMDAIKYSLNIEQ